jgi:hypothetical protein
MMTSTNKLRITFGQEAMMVPRYEGYSLDDDGFLRFNRKIYIPPNDELRSFILSEVHRAIYRIIWESR